MNATALLLLVLTLPNPPSAAQMARVNQWTQVCCPREVCINRKTRVEPTAPNDASCDGTKKMASD
jgi:hypothetical protein